MWFKPFYTLFTKLQCLHYKPLHNSYKKLILAIAERYKEGMLVALNMAMSAANIFCTLGQNCTSTQFSLGGPDVAALTLLPGFCSALSRSVLHSKPWATYLIYNSWTPVKLQKHLKDGQKKSDAPEHNFRCQIWIVCECLCNCDV